MNSRVRSLKFTYACDSCGAIAGNFKANVLVSAYSLEWWMGQRSMRLCKCGRMLITYPAILCAKDERETR